MTAASNNQSFPLTVNRLLLYFTAVASVVLTLGLSGRLAVADQYSIDIVIIVLWLYCWLAPLNVAMLFALTAGVIIDFISFLPFGTWTAILCALTFGLVWLRDRYLTISSYWQSVLALLVTSLAYHLLVGAVVRSFYPYQVLVSLLLNVLVGSVLYYLLVIRFRMLQRWRGQQL